MSVVMMEFEAINRALFLMLNAPVGLSWRISGLRDCGLQLLSPCSRGDSRFRRRARSASRPGLPNLRCSRGGARTGYQLYPWSRFPAPASVHDRGWAYVSPARPREQLSKRSRNADVDLDLWITDATIPKTSRVVGSDPCGTYELGACLSGPAFSVRCSRIDRCRRLRPRHSRSVAIVDRKVNHAFGCETSPRSAGADRPQVTFISLEASDASLRILLSID